MSRPEPAGIDPRGPRFTAAITALLLLVVAVLGFGGAALAAWILLAVLSALFAWSAIAGVRRNPFGRLFARFIRPRLAWRTAERVIRRATGSGPLPTDAPATRTISRHVRCDTIVVGAGTAGLTAALEAAADDEQVLLCDEFAIGAGITPGPTLDTIRGLEARVRSDPAIEIIVADNASPGGGAVSNPASARYYARDGDPDASADADPAAAR